MLNETHSTDSAGGHSLVENTRDPYDFPIALRALRTEDGHPVPRSRAVVRTDTNEAISVVSDKYRLIKHETFMEAIDPFVHELGRPETKFHVQKNGAFFGVEYIFKNHTVEIGGKETAALRILGHNAYIPGFMLHLRVATMVLDCLNLALFHEKSLFALSVAHRGQEQKIELPKPEKVLMAFTSGTNVFNRYSQMQIDEDRGQHFLLEDEHVVHTLPEGLREDIAGRWSAGYEEGERSVWHLLQAATYEITHNSPRLSYTGRLQRLQKVARLFNKEFAGY